jgi:hypothetical protein
VTVGNIAKEQLRKDIRSVHLRGALGGPDVLLRLANRAREIARDKSCAGRASAFLLSAIFSELAERQTDIAVAFADASKLWERLGQPVTRMVDLVLERESRADADVIAASLVDAFFRAVDPAPD